MSAFVHTEDHIDLLVALAVHEETYIVVRTPEHGDGYLCVGLTTTGTQQLDERITPTELGRLLLAENVASVRYRYGETVDETPEGVEYDLSVSTYRHRATTLTARALGAHWAVAGIKAIDGYTYQSCEHPGWETSQAKQWVESTAHRLHHHLPGYDTATTWDYQRTRTRRSA